MIIIIHPDLKFRPFSREVPLPTYLCDRPHSHICTIFALQANWNVSQMDNHSTRQQNLSSKSSKRILQSSKPNINSLFSENIRTMKIKSLKNGPTNNYTPKNQHVLWKLMLGRRSCPFWGLVTFQGRLLLNFGGSKIKNHQLIITSWWLNQPIWKEFSNWILFPG